MTEAVNTRRPDTCRIEPSGTASTTPSWAAACPKAPTMTSPIATVIKRLSSRERSALVCRTCSKLNTRENAVLRPQEVMSEDLRELTDLLLSPLAKPRGRSLAISRL